MKPIVPVLEDLLRQRVKFIDDCYGVESLRASLEMNKQDIVLLENLRFHKEEEGSFKDSNGKKVKASPDSIESFRMHLNALGGT